MEPIPIMFFQVLTWEESILAYLNGAIGCLAVIAFAILALGMVQYRFSSGEDIPPVDSL